MLMGVILAGGRSRRMGRDKAELSVAGEPLWQRQARVLREAGAARVALVLRPGQIPPSGAGASALQVRRDVYRNAGPMAGLHAALTPPPWANWYLVLAVDLPHVRPDWFGWLLGFCRDRTGAIVQHDTGYEPLAAVYPAGAGPVVAAHLERGEHSLQRLAERLVQTRRMRAIPLPAPARTQVTNWNTPADVADRKSGRPAFSHEISHDR